jgi:hypothetical protein
MKVNKNSSGLPDQELKAESFNLTDLVLLIGYKLTAYIGGETFSAWRIGSRMVYRRVLNHACGPLST